ncbi:MAG: chemotaxis protein CheX [Lachnospiraceae bacterium]|nr:chemotaxis protein CheX [Lachnospiraceae bacterium]
MEIRPEHLNPFLISSVHVFKQVCMLDPKIGKLQLAQSIPEERQIYIIFGITGEITGQVVLIFNEEVAKKIASAMMCGMEVNSLDEMARSALSELGNMIMGNAATILADDNILIDITPPALGEGQVVLTAPEIRTLQVPVDLGIGDLQVCFMLKFANKD